MFTKDTVTNAFVQQDDTKPAMSKKAIAGVLAATACVAGVVGVVSMPQQETFLGAPLMNMDAGHYAEEAGSCARTSDNDWDQHYAYHVEGSAANDYAGCEQSCNSTTTCAAFDVSQVGCWLFNTDPASGYHGGLPNLVGSTCYIWTAAGGNAPAAAAGGAGGSGHKFEYTNIQITAHNAYRAKHHAGPLTYNEELAKGAQEWAEMMSSTNNMHHSSGSYGENLAMAVGYPGYSENAQATDMWYEESVNPGYDYNNAGFGHGTGHFTQVVWKETTEIGCGESGGWTCCRYLPAGNMSMPGWFEKNVLPME